jgi:hypothetical protein
MPSDGLNKVCQQLSNQSKSESQPWDQLIVKNKDGNNLRAISPNVGIQQNPSLFSGYYQSYVDQVWNKYKNTNLPIDT